MMRIGAVVDGASRYKLYYYSAHNTTLTQISLSLQVAAGDGMLPPFAQTLVVELI
ncbi:hypothetical protein JKF63_04898 [Porcisia hertigi]|uniref:Uncharacterized protein n=1 Tax=Porcisia hertigi TaxID=2761500 RepID=A0A836IRT1_9TRYP|nr:hypothetical protein JKF63_04898 [Porcisia hertigi]